MLNCLLVRISEKQVLTYFIILCDLVTALCDAKQTVSSGSYALASALHLLSFFLLR